MLFSTPKFVAWSCLVLALSVFDACNGGGEQTGPSGLGGDAQGGDVGSNLGGSGAESGGGGVTPESQGGGGIAGDRADGGISGAGGSPAPGNGGAGVASGGAGGTSGGAGISGAGGSGNRSPNFGLNENDPKAKNWVFVMLGQSNMAGMSLIEAEDRVAVPRVFKLTRGKTWAAGTEGFKITPWSSLTGAPSALGTSDLSPSRAFAAELLKSIPDPNVNIYVVNAAKSGSNIESWEPGVGTNYVNMIPWLDEGLKMGLLRGFVWHQGEANSGTPPAEYAGKLRAIMAALRTKVGNPAMPVVAGEVGKTSSDTSRVNQALAMIAAVDLRFAVATSEDLTGDVHYSSSSEREFGRRMAAALWRIVTR